MKPIILLLFLTFIAYSSEKIPVAVNDLKAHGIGESETSIISERVRSELIKTGLYRVMERGEMNMILEEQGFQQSGACSDASCLVEVGQMLAVNRIITGSIGFIGNMFTLSLKMVDVESGEIVNTSNVDYRGDIAGFLSQSIATGVRNLNSTTSSAPADLNGKSFISVYTYPQGASLFANGEKIGKSPIEKYEIKNGEINLNISERDYLTLDTLFYVNPNESKELTFTLVKSDKATPKKNKVLKTLGFSVGGTLMIAGVVGGIMLDQKLQERQKEYDELRTSNPQRFDELHEEMDNAKLYRNISYVTAGAGAGLITVSFFF